MINTELRPLIFNFSDEDDVTEEEDGSPVLPKNDDGATSDPGNGDADGFGLDGDMIEAPGEEEF